jgi:hypothetical protein
MSQCLKAGGLTVGTRHGFEHGVEGDGTLGGVVEIQDYVVAQPGRSFRLKLRQIRIERCERVTLVECLFVERGW